MGEQVRSEWKSIQQRRHSEKTQTLLLWHSLHRWLVPWQWWILPNSCWLNKWTWSRHFRRGNRTNNNPDCLERIANDIFPISCSPLLYPALLVLHVVELLDCGRNDWKREEVSPHILLLNPYKLLFHRDAGTLLSNLNWFRLPPRWGELHWTNSSHVCNSNNDTVLAWKQLKRQTLMGVSGQVYCLDNHCSLLMDQVPHLLEALQSVWASASNY